MIKIVWKNQTVEYEISFNIQVNETMLFWFNKNGPPFFLFTNVHLIIARLFLIFILMHKLRNICNLYVDGPLYVLVNSFVVYILYVLYFGTSNKISV